jgi:hypothetical protein
MTMEEGKGRGGALAALLAVAALGVAAVPAYGALSDGPGSTGAATQETAPSFVQEEQRPEQAPRGERDKDCPFKDGGGEGNGRGSGGNGQQQEGVSSDSETLY